MQTTYILSSREKETAANYLIVAWSPSNGRPIHWEMKNGPYFESLLDMHDNVSRSLMAIRGSQSGEMQFDDILSNFRQEITQCRHSVQPLHLAHQQTSRFWKNIQMLIFDKVTARVETRSP